MSQLSAERKTLEILAEDFVVRYRRGERPPLSDYIAAHPELADEIRELFPALVMMEELAPSDSDSSAPAGAVATQQPRRALGDYRILREIGRGGMGVVYEAEQLSLGRRVALKVVPRRAAADATIRQRFHREARAAAQLHHTNIVPVFEVGEDQDACWYAMQLILGQGLDQVIEELRQQRQLSGAHSVPRTAPAPAALSQVTQALVCGQFHCPDLDDSPSPSAAAEGSTERVSVDPHDSSPSASRSELSAGDSTRGQYYRSVARIGRQAAEGLAYAHARGIIHRDIKPSNLLLDTAGVVWITDFGLAKTQDHSLTTTGDIVGTLRYMAPERFKGEGDERADVYGLGLTLYELLVLRPAFAERDRLQLIDHIKNQQPTRPRLLDPCIPRDLETIVLKATDKETHRRYPSAEAMAEDLRRFLADEPIKARRTGELERLRLWARRNPALAALSSSLLLLLVLVAAGATAMALYLRATLKESEANREFAETAELEGKQELWLSYLAQAQARRMSQQPGQRFASLHAIRGALDLPVPPGHSRDELRTEAIAALCLADMALAHQGGRALVGSEGFAIDPAFERYAVADRDGKVSIRRLRYDAELLQLPGAGYVSPYAGLSFSPDGRFLDQRCQVRQGRGSRLWDLSKSPPRAVLEDDHTALTFRPDCRQYAASYPDRTVRIFETASGRELRRLPVAAVPPGFGVLWNPRLPQLLLDARTSLHLLNLDTGEIVKTGPTFARGNASSWTTWHPEGRLFAVADQEMIIHLWDVPTGRPFLPPLEGHKAGGVVVAFNHAGDRLLSSDWSATWRLWDSRSGKLLLTVPAGGVNLSFAPDDRRAGSGSGGKVHLLHVCNGREMRTIVHRNSPGKRSYATEGRSVVDAEGRLCAVEMHDKVEGIPIVDVLRGEEVALLPIPGNVPLLFDRDGALWTCGSAGLLRWPLSAGPAKGQHRYGPPQRILSRANGALRASPDLQVLAIPYNENGTVVIHRNDGRSLRLGPQNDVRFCDVSPDNRWIATGSHWLREGPGAKVWDARDGRLVKDLPVGPGIIKFSPDGKWLLTTSGGCRLWAVGTWEEGPKLAGSLVHPSAAFSADGKLLALAEAPSVVRLVVTDTGAEVARLTVPERTPLLPCCFTPDGRRLITGGLTTRDLHVFDLAVLRGGLSELGLDWDAPSPAVSASENAAAPDPEPLSIAFDLGDLRHWAEADALVKQAAQQVGNKEYARALATLRRAVQIAPTCAAAHNNLAWLLLTGPEELRDPAQALTLARKAVELAGEQPSHLNTLGLALYRCGRFAEAIPMLERSLREGKGRADAHDLFFLAMCHHRLGDADRAGEFRRRAAEWFQAHRDKRSANENREMTEFQAEADAVLAQPLGQAKK